MSFVPCVKWIKKGVVTGKPEKVSLTRDELSEIVSSPSGNWQVMRDSDCEDNSVHSGEEDNLDRYNFESYDDPEDNSSNPLGIGSLAVYSSNHNDQFINIPGMDDDDTDDEDDLIKPTDNLIIVGKSSREKSGNDLLEVHVYNEEDGDRYVHHDIALVSCPLSIEPLFHGTFIAIGEMKPFIEIHNLNIINPVEPCGRLGSNKDIAKNKCHQSAVLDLSWNSNYIHILASGSADKSVIMWDLEVLKSSTIFSDNNGNVENISWDLEQSQSLLTCCSDGHVRIFDGRQLTVSSDWSVSGEVLSCEWCENTQNFVVGTSNGKIYKFDKRKNNPIWEIAAHDSDVTGLACLPGYSGLISSASVSGCVKVWDTKSSSPINVYSHVFDSEELHSLSVNPDVGSVACLGGANHKKKFLEIINFSSLSEVIKNWNLSH